MSQSTKRHWPPPPPPDFIPEGWLPLFEVPGTALKTKVREQSKVEDWTYHACRDTISTWLQDQGHSEYERGLMLNHAESGVTADYGHGYPNKLKRELTEKWANHVAQEVQPKGAVLLS